MPINVEIIGEENLGKMAEFYRRAQLSTSARLQESTLKFLLRAEGVAKKRHLSGPRPENLQPVTGRLRSSITSRVTARDKNIEGVLGTNVKYARLHELGGEIRVTDRMRKYFWARHKRTGDEKWRNMALTKKTAFKFPARPFLQPAIEAEMPSFEKDIARTMKTNLSPGDLRGE